MYLFFSSCIGHPPILCLCHSMGVIYYNILVFVRRWRKAMTLNLIFIPFLPPQMQPATVTRSASVKSWGGDGLGFRPKLRHGLRRLKLYLLLLGQMRDNNSMIRGITLTRNRLNSIFCTNRTFRRSCNQSGCCLQMVESL